MAAAFAILTATDLPNSTAGDHRMAAARICCTSSDTRPPVPASVTESVLHSEPGRDFADTLCAFRTLRVHRAGVGIRLWGR